MIEEPRCYARKCKHFRGLTNVDEQITEAGEVPFCFAYPSGIPERIAYGTDDHLVPADDQFGSLVFEEGPFLRDQEG